MTMVATPLTFSIATGLSLGLLSYTFVKLGTGRHRGDQPADLGFVGPFSAALRVSRKRMIGRYSRPSRSACPACACTGLQRRASRQGTIMLHSVAPARDIRAKRRKGDRMHRFTGILGMITMMGLAYAFSTNRRAIRYKTVAWGLGLQIAFAFLVMRSEYGRLAFEKLGAGANWLLDFAYYGTSFVFGDLGREELRPRLLFRLSSAADHHLYRGFVRRALLPRASCNWS